MVLTTQDFASLFEQGLCYRHTTEHWQEIQGLGSTLYSSPRREVRGQTQYTEELIQPLLDPITLSQSDRRSLEQIVAAWNAAAAVQMDIVRSGLNGVAQFQPIAEFVVPKALRTLATRDVGYSQPISPYIRFDMLKTDAGWKIIDINSTRPGGVGDLILLTQCLKSVRDQRSMINIRSEFCFVVSQCWNSWAHRQGVNANARIGIIASESDGDWNNFRVLANVLKDQSWVTSCELIEQVPDPDDRRFNCIIRSRIKFGHPQFQRIVQLPTNRFCVISPPCRRWIGDKNWFILMQKPPVLTELMKKLPEDQVKTILASIPETGMFTGSGFVEFPDGSVVDSQFINRAEWMIKPASGSSGKGIVIGRGTNKHRWDDICSQPSVVGSLLQRFYRCKQEVAVMGADGSPTTQMLYVKYGVFSFNGVLGGIEVRARSSALVHGTRDAYISTCVFRNDERW